MEEELLRIKNQNKVDEEHRSKRTTEGNKSHEKEERGIKIQSKQRCSFHSLASGCIRLIGLCRLEVEGWVKVSDSLTKAMEKADSEG